MSSKTAAPDSEAPGKEALVPFEPFVFAPVGDGGASGAGFAGGTRPQGQAHAGGAAPSATEQEIYQKGVAEGEVRARSVFEKSLANARGEVSEALRQFSAQRESYFQRVESEVVQLALSIARKILHREAQIDPLLLTGIVRVALESLNEGTQVRLRANPQEIPSWREDFRLSGDISPAPELIGDASLRPGCCVLETEVGSTEISLETQLKEIEQGFLDLLQQRPRVQE